MKTAESEFARFNQIVLRCGKQHLRMRMRILHCERIGVHVVVHTETSGAAYQLGRSWPTAFARDLQAGTFG